MAEIAHLAPGAEGYGVEIRRKKDTPRARHSTFNRFDASDVIHFTDADPVVAQNGVAPVT